MQVNNLNKSVPTELTQFTGGENFKYRTTYDSTLRYDGNRDEWQEVDRLSSSRRYHGMSAVPGDLARYCLPAPTATHDDKKTPAHTQSNTQAADDKE